MPRKSFSKTAIMGLSSILLIFPIYGKAQSITANYIVTLKKSNRAIDTLSTHGLKAKHIYTRAINGFAVALTSDELEALNSDPRVERIEPDPVGEMASTQFNAPAQVDRVDQRSRPLDGIFSAQYDGTGVKIYIIDGGINYSHSEFGGRAIPGWDVDNAGGIDCPGGGGHGTRVASSAGGQTLGLAKNATLVSVKVYPCATQSLLGSNVIAGIDWILANNTGPAVANFSSRFNSAYPAINNAFARLVAAGIQVTTSAGNSSTTACTASPQMVSELITVGSVDDQDAKTSWSNYGPCVAWFAPGVNIIGADYQSTTGYITQSGTSFSSALSAGIVANYLQGHPFATSAQVKEAVYSHTTKNIVASANSGNNHLLYANEEFMAPLNYPPTANITNLIDGGFLTKNTNITIQASASDRDGTIASVKFYIGGVLKCTDTTAPYSCVFKTAAKAGVSYEIYAVSTDNLGLVAETRHFLLTTN